jgi:hypothetical protein
MSIKPTILAPDPTPAPVTRSETVKDSEGAEPTPKTEPPYRPYTEAPVSTTAVYKPYADKPEEPELPYEPYKGI